MRPSFLSGRPVESLDGRKRVWAPALLCLLLALLVAACGGGDSEPGTEEQGGDGAKPAGVQELAVGYSADPWVEGSESDQKRKPNYPLNADVCETLVTLTPDFEVAEGLASKWEYVGDNTFRFTLKDGPTFSDGSPVTAEDVKYTLDYTAEEPETSGFGFIGTDSTKVVDERTVEVTPTEPNLRLLEQITHPTYSIIKKGSDPFSDLDTLVCSGPFQVAEYVPSERLVVQRNDNYWGEPAKLDTITFRFIPDDTTRTLALQNGEVDLIADVPRAVLPSVEGLADVKTEEAPVGQVYLGYLAQREVDGTRRLLADPALRRAVAHSMNQEAYVEGVLGGNAEVVEMVAPPTVLGEYADMVEGIPYDPDRARRLLDQAGWRMGPEEVRVKDGRPLQLDIALASGAGGGTDIDLTTAEFVQAQLAEVGIKGNILRLDSGAYRTRLENGKYDIDLSGPNQNDANPAFLLSLRWYSKSSVPNAKIIAPGSDTEFERLIDRSQEATNRDELKRLAAQTMHELVDNEVAVMPLAGVYRIYAMKDSVQGFETHPSSTNQRWASVFRSE